MIAVFGASVTQQKNGYATKLQKYFNHPIKIFGYGGMRLNNAALCFIDEVIAPKPSYCFFCLWLAIIVKSDFFPSTILTQTLQLRAFRPTFRSRTVHNFLKKQTQ